MKADVAMNALNGYNVALLAYGTTNSGKTHTCMGTESNPGLVPRIAGMPVKSVDSCRKLKFTICASQFLIADVLTHILVTSLQTMLGKPKFIFKFA
jgi:hypothetical protein